MKKILIAAVFQIMTVLAFAQTNEPTLQNKSYSFDAYHGWSGLNRQSWENDFNRYLRQATRAIPGASFGYVIAYEFAKNGLDYMSFRGEIGRQVPAHGKENLFRQSISSNTAVLDMSLGQCTKYFYPDRTVSYIEKIMQSLVSSGLITDFEVKLIRDPDCGDQNVPVGALKLSLWYTEYTPN